MSRFLELRLKLDSATVHPNALFEEVTGRCEPLTSPAVWSAPRSAWGLLPDLIEILYLTFQLLLIFPQQQPNSSSEFGCALVGLCVNADAWRHVEESVTVSSPQGRARSCWEKAGAPRTLWDRQTHTTLGSWPQGKRRCLDFFVSNCDDWRPTDFLFWVPNKTSNMCQEKKHIWNMQ